MRILRFAAFLVGIACVAMFAMFFVSLFQKANWLVVAGYASGYYVAGLVFFLLISLDIKLHPGSQPLSVYD